MSEEQPYQPPDTPRTNAAALEINGLGVGDRLDWISFARQLERELNAKTTPTDAIQTGIALSHALKRTLEPTSVASQRLSSGTPEGTVETVSTPSASVTVEEIAREAAQEIADSNSQVEEPTLEYHVILEAITAALAPLEAEIQDAKTRADCGPNCTLASAIEGNKMALEQMGQSCQRLQAELEQAKDRAHYLRNALDLSDARLVTAEADTKLLDWVAEHFSFYGGQFYRLTADESREWGGNLRKELAAARAKEGQT